MSNLTHLGPWVMSLLELLQSLAHSIGCRPGRCAAEEVPRVDHASLFKLPSVHLYWIHLIVRFDWIWLIWTCGRHCEPGHDRRLQHISTMLQDRNSKRLWPWRKLHWRKVLKWNQISKKSKVFSFVVCVSSDEPFDSSRVFTAAIKICPKQTNQKYSDKY